MPLFLLLLATLLVVLIAIAAFYRFLVHWGKKVREKEQILKRVADLEDHRRGP